MSILRFRLGIEPQSLQTSGKRLKFVHGRPLFFLSKEAKAYRAQLAAKLAIHRPAAPLQGALRGDFIFVLPRIQEYRWKWVPFVRLLHFKRPDADNLLKSFSDVLTENGFFCDDGQLADVRIRKFYAAVHEQPCIEVEIEAFAAYSPELQQPALLP